MLAAAFANSAVVAADFLSSHLVPSTVGLKSVLLPLLKAPAKLE